MQKTTKDTEETVDGEKKPHLSIKKFTVASVVHYLAAKWSEIIASLAKCSAQDMGDFVLLRILNNNS